MFLPPWRGPLPEPGWYWVRFTRPGGDRVLALACVAGESIMCHDPCKPGSYWFVPDDATAKFTPLEIPSP